MISTTDVIHNFKIFSYFVTTTSTQTMVEPWSGVPAIVYMCVAIPGKFIYTTTYQVIVITDVFQMFTEQCFFNYVGVQGTDYKYIRALQLIDDTH